MRKKFGAQELFILQILQGDSKRDWLNDHSAETRRKSSIKNINNTRQRARAGDNYRINMNNSPATFRIEAGFQEAQETAEVALQELFGTTSEEGSLRGFSPPPDLDIDLIFEDTGESEEEEEQGAQMVYNTPSFCSQVFPGWDTAPSRPGAAMAPVIDTSAQAGPLECSEALTQRLLRCFHAIPSEALGAYQSLRDFRSQVDMSHFWYNVRAWAFMLNAPGWESRISFRLPTGTTTAPVSLINTIHGLQRRSGSILKTPGLRNEVRQLGFSMLVEPNNARARLARSLAVMLLGKKRAGWAGGATSDEQTTTEAFGLVRLIESELPADLPHIYAEGDRFTNFVNQVFSLPHGGNRRATGRPNSLRSSPLTDILRVYNHLVRVVEKLVPPRVACGFHILEHASYARSAGRTEKKKECAEEALHDGVLDLADRRAAILLRQQLPDNERERDRRRRQLRHYLQDLLVGVMEAYRPPGVGPRRLQDARPLTPPTSPRDQGGARERRQQRLARRLRRRLQVPDTQQGEVANDAVNEFNRGIQMLVDNIHAVGDDRIQQWLALFSTSDQSANTSTDGSEIGASDGEASESDDTSSEDDGTLEPLEPYSQHDAFSATAPPTRGLVTGPAQPQAMASTMANTVVPPVGEPAAESTVVPERVTRPREWDEFWGTSSVKRPREF